MKEAVRRAVTVIRNQRHTYISTQKEGYGGDLNDVFTSTDTAAQAVYVKCLGEWFPGVGLIGEEAKLSIPCTLPNIDAYFTIDPLDGTKAFVRDQSHGVASMLSLVVNGHVVSAWIGDVNTEELYGYRAGSEKVHRIDQYERSRYLHMKERKDDLGKSYILLRDPLLETTPVEVTVLVKRSKEYQIDGGSIGTWMARLWKGEVDGVVLSPGHETPWDSTPIMGISQKLGFVFLGNQTGFWVPYEPALVKQPEVRKHWVAIVPASLVNEVLA